MTFRELMHALAVLVAMLAVASCSDSRGASSIEDAGDAGNRSDASAVLDSGGSTDASRLPDSGSVSNTDAGRDSSTAGDADSGTDAGDGGSANDDATSQAACEPTGTPGPLNDAGTAILPTGTYTWWSWNVPQLRSLDWTVNIDKRTGNQGYFWSHEFYFADGGGGGYVGIQDNGDYQSSPDAASVTTQMVLFSVAGGAEQAVLGDIQPPSGEVSPGFDGNTPDAFSIHAEYVWSVCVPYHFRLWVVSTDADGNFWLAASVTDPVAATTSVIGKILISAGVGGITPGTVNWTEHWQTNDGTPMTSCAAQAHSSAVFSYPIANGSEAVTGYTNDFGALQCPSARFTALDAGIRQEMGVGGL